MRITNDDVFNPHPVFGSQPHIFHGDDAPDATSRFTNKGIGSEYIRHVATGHYQLYKKVKSDNLAGDWKCVSGIISEKVTAAGLTDGGAAAGTKTFANDIPLGAIVTSTTVQDVTGFAGDVSATFTLGDGTDVDRYNTGTPSLFTTIAYLSVGAPSGTAFHSAAKTPTLTVTSSSDIGLVIAAAAGVATFHISYHM